MNRASESFVPMATWWAAHAAPHDSANQDSSLPGRGYRPEIDYTALLIAGRVLPAQHSTDSTKATAAQPVVWQRALSTSGAGNLETYGNLRKLAKFMKTCKNLQKPTYTI